MMLNFFVNSRNYASKHPSYDRYYYDQHHDVPRFNLLPGSRCVVVAKRATVVLLAAQLATRSLTLALLAAQLATRSLTR